ncbi:MAG: SPOR domain-containing protein [Polaribacter sp.]|nr:SPOR domain-containing protein [Polaribacter sp.]MDG1810529.1 SPOR domain-containing protein [Polaribacter sp.]MDG1994833.1 SPOR domain-containing protein [Polaribacter sp.]
MKIHITKKVLIFSLFIALTVSYTACKDNNAAYQKELETADALFKKQQYNEAKNYYLKASELNTEEAYPKNQIQKINTLVAEIEAEKLKQKEAALAAKAKEAETKIIVVEKPYVVTVASYAIASNANAHQEQLNKKGYTSSIVKSNKGNFLVGLEAFDTLTKAYNYLESLGISRDYDLDKAWVYEIKQ